MNSPKKPRSLQDIHRRRQQISFVGRENQLELFRQNLAYPLDDERRRFIFNISGQGGVGKTTLLKQFQKIVEDSEGVTAYVDEGERDVPSVLGRIANDMERKDLKLTQFSDRYRVYRQKIQELETDPEAPQGFSAFLGRNIAKSAMKLGRQVPLANLALDLMDEEAMASQAGEWAAYLARKLSNKDEVYLIREPLEVLIPLFLEDLRKVKDTVTVALFFDTYEQTGDFLDKCIREILDGRYGDVPLNLLLVLAGREGLNPNDWAAFEDLLVRLPLDAFSEEEARQYLSRRGITHEQVIQSILTLSGHLPLLVATLAEGTPSEPNQVGDPSGTAVERFLKWETDPVLRQISLDAALPRFLNKDVIAQLHKEGEADTLFNWLKKKPFVRERTDGWVYHDVARNQMLRFKRLVSPQDWTNIQGTLVDYYEALRGNLQLPADQCYLDPSWQAFTLEILYHRLCQAPEQNLGIVLNEFLVTLKSQFTFSQKWAEILIQSGKDRDAEQILDWGEKLAEGLKAFEEERYEVTILMFTSLTNLPGIEPQWQSVALGWRGETYRLMKQYDKALNDFNQAISVDPSYVWALHHRGLTYRKLKRYGEALDDFDQVIDLEPSALIFSERGDTYRILEHYEKALADFNQAIQLEPSAVRFSRRGYIYRQMEKYEEALEDFDRAIELGPTATRYSRRGFTCRLFGKNEEALADFSKALELNPRSGLIYLRRGISLRLMQRYEEALADLNQSLLLDGNKSWVLFNRALTYKLFGNLEQSRKDYSEALRTAQESCSKEANDCTNTFHLALYYLAAGNYKEAKYYYHIALQLASIERIQFAIQHIKDFLSSFPHHTSAKEIQQELQSELQRRRTTPPPLPLRS